MKPGLKIVSVMAGAYPYVFVGWLKRDGDEITLRNARVIRRFGSNAALAALASKGPQADTQLLAPATEEISRLHVTRSIPADEKAWAKDCPKPDDWD